LDALLELFEKALIHCCLSVNRLFFVYTITRFFTENKRDFFFPIAFF